MGWDQATYMPPGGAEARGRQLALLSRLGHERLVEPAIGRLLDALAPWADAQGADSDVAALVRVTRRDFDRATRVPSAFIQRLSEHAAASYHAWERARPANDFAAMRPLLEKTVELSRELAAFHPGYAHPYDALIDLAEDGMTVATVRALFTELRAGLVPLIAAIRACPEIDDRCLEGAFPEAAQQAFGEKVIRAFGYDYERGRQDKTAHPFMTKFGRGDVRITTRYRADNLSDGLFSTLHEAGHAMYEQGDRRRRSRARRSFTGTTSGRPRKPVAAVGEPRGPQPAVLAPLVPAAAGRVPRRSSATCDARHVLSRDQQGARVADPHRRRRSDLQPARDAALRPRARAAGGHARSRRPAGSLARPHAELTSASSPPDDRDGVLQDVHWYGGIVGGAFQSYTLGNIMSAQFFAAARRDLGDLDRQIGAGEFAPLRAWLTDRIYRHGRKFTAPEIVQRATGEPLSIAPYLAYLNTKYGALYRL